jgi:hypothetical protein
MREILESIFDPTVFGIGVTFLITIGAALLSLGRKRHKAARIYFVLAAAWTYGMLIMWSYFTSQRLIVRVVITFVAWGSVGALLNEALRVTKLPGAIRQGKEGRALPAPTPNNMENKPQPGPTEAPTLLMLCEIRQALPIKISPNVTKHVLALNPAITYGVSELSNNGNDVMWWPEKPRKQSQFQMGIGMSVCHFENHSDRALLSIVLNFRVMT